MELASYQNDGNAYRNFVRWIGKQPWRKALPEPDENLTHAKAYTHATASFASDS